MRLLPGKLCALIPPPRAHTVLYNGIVDGAPSAGSVLRYAAAVYARAVVIPALLPALGACAPGRTPDPATLAQAPAPPVQPPAAAPEEHVGDDLEELDGDAPVGPIPSGASVPWAVVTPTDPLRQLDGGYIHTCGLSDAG